MEQYSQKNLKKVGLKQLLERDEIMNKRYNYGVGVDNFNQYPPNGRDAITKRPDLNFINGEFSKIGGEKKRKSKKSMTHKRSKNLKRRRKITYRKRRRNI